MSRIGIFFAEGYEEIEALTVVDLVRRAGISIDMISVTEAGEVTGSHGITGKNGQNAWQNRLFPAGYACSSRRYAGDQKGLRTVKR